MKLKLGRLLSALSLQSVALTRSLLGRSTCDLEHLPAIRPPFFADTCSRVSEYLSYFIPDLAHAFDTAV